VYKWLEASLDYGITEEQFWNMTIAELERAINSKRRTQKLEAQEKAAYHYILAELIGKSVARIYSSTITMPELSEVYPSLFDSEEVQEKIQEKKDELSALRFKQFADAHNNKIKKEAANSE
jgi:ribosomal protein L29